MLGAITTRFDAQRALEYLDGIGETLPVYGADGVAHPGWLLRRANRILAANVTLGPWIHVGSDVRLFDRVHDGERVLTDASVIRVWERHGHKFVTLDVLITAGDVRDGAGCDANRAHRDLRTSVPRIGLKVRGSFSRRSNPLASWPCGQSGGSS